MRSLGLNNLVPLAKSSTEAWGTSLSDLWVAPSGDSSTIQSWKRPNDACAALPRALLEAF
eukprot:5548122-Pyramimonas_sp.AAC.1